MAATTRYYETTVAVKLVTDDETRLTDKQALKAAADSVKHRFSPSFGLLQTSGSISAYIRQTRALKSYTPGNKSKAKPSLTAEEKQALIKAGVMAKSGRLYSTRELLEMSYKGKGSKRIRPGPNPLPVECTSPPKTIDYCATCGILYIRCTSGSEAKWPSKWLDQPEGHFSDGHKVVRLYNADVEIVQVRPKVRRKK
ncbi:MAG: hypothetical protein JRN62_03445 [Nitrososphaerota archaeon]|jgi:hypothetical protein|nr:hypothetical protein [Nitrososphaerota archaeon]MDG6948654.1 hypothetical protein [Nitrososphaerota archaeon]